METQKTQNSWSSLEKEEWSWRNKPSWLQIILQSYSHQDSMVLPQKQKYRPMKQDSEEELKRLLMKVKEESGKVGLKLNIHKTKIMASSPITSWEICGETVDTVSDFIFLASKITADGDYSHEIKRHLLLERKVMTNLAVY